jgi:transcriptional regulator with XRE-family HTH domain
VLRRNIRDRRERLGWTQAELAEAMTLTTGAPMKRDAVSRIESGKHGISYDQAVAFAGVLEVPFVRLASPRSDEEIAVRVDFRRPPLRPIALRNWFVYGHSWTPAARGAQRMMKLAYAARDLANPRLGEQRRAAAKARAAELLRLR